MAPPPHGTGEGAGTGPRAQVRTIIDQRDDVHVTTRSSPSIHMKRASAAAQRHGWRPLAVPRRGGKRRLGGEDCASAAAAQVGGCRLPLPGLPLPASRTAVRGQHRRQRRRTATCNEKDRMIRLSLDMVVRVTGDEGLHCGACGVDVCIASRPAAQCHACRTQQ